MGVVGQRLVWRPVGVGGDVFDDHRLAGGRRCTTRADPVADADAVDGLAVGGRKAGGGAVEQVLAGVVEEEDGGEDTVDLALHQVTDRLQHLGEGAVVVDHVKDLAVSGEPLSRLVLGGVQVGCGVDCWFHGFYLRVGPSWRFSARYVSRQLGPYGAPVAI